MTLLQLTPTELRTIIREEITEAFKLMPDRAISAERAAEMLQCSIDTIRRKAKRGELTRIPGTRSQYSERQVMNLISKNL